jgi:FXSXX-COOH protein
MADEVADRGSALLDLSGLDLEALAGLPETVLVGALQEILRDTGTDRFSSFQSALP